jgi:preprotein translocase subunit SecD
LAGPGPVQAKWTALTKEAADAGQGQAGQVAIVLDTEVVTAPQILESITGDAVISGGLDELRATTLAADLRYGVLPVKLAVTSATVVH